MGYRRIPLEQSEKKFRTILNKSLATPTRARRPPALHKPHSSRSRDHRSKDNTHSYLLVYVDLANVPAGPMSLGGAWKSLFSRALHLALRAP